MIRMFMLTLFAIMLIACEKNAVAQPQLVVQDTVNWGLVVPEGDPEESPTVEKDVVLRNAGDSLLRILNVRPGCGCTSAPLDKDSLLPGEETVMHVKLNLPTHNGKLHKTITITTNDTANPQTVVHLVAEVQRPLQMSSSFIGFNKGKVGKEVEGSITFTYTKAGAVSINAKSMDPKYQIVSPLPLVVKEGQSADLIVKYTPEKQGSFRVQVQIETDLKGYEKFYVHGYGSADP